MTTTPNPITPPAELVREWYNASPNVNEKALQDVATAAAQWGADQELEACCEWLQLCPPWPDDLRRCRRPKPPSKVAQAEALIERHEDGWMPSPSEWHLIREALAEGRRALESINE